MGIDPKLLPAHYRLQVEAQKYRIENYPHATKLRPAVAKPKPAPALDVRPAREVRGMGSSDLRHRVRIVQYRTRLLDPDNLVYSAKEINDFLVACALIHGDSPSEIALEVEQIKVAHRCEQKTVIEIEPIADFDEGSTVINIPLHGISEEVIYLPPPGQIINWPTEEGRDIGLVLSQLADCPTHEMCLDCVFRAGSFVNQCPGTLHDAMASLIYPSKEGPFICNHPDDGGENRVCAGYKRALSKIDPAIRKKVLAIEAQP